MNCHDCNKESVMRPTDIVIEDSCTEEIGIIFYWSCPRCGAVHTTYGEPIRWEL